MTATSLTVSSLSIEGRSITDTWLNMPLGGTKPISLDSMPRMYLSVETNPFINMSPLPEATNDTAVATDSMSPFSSSISNLDGSIFSARQMSVIVVLSPTRVAVTMPLSTASAQAFIVWESLAYAATSRLRAAPPPWRGGLGGLRSSVLFSYLYGAMLCV